MQELIYRFGLLGWVVAVASLLGALAPEAAQAQSPPISFAERIAPSTLELFLDPSVDRASVTPERFRSYAHELPTALTWVDDSDRLRLHFAAAVTGPTLFVSGLRRTTGATIPATHVSVAYPPAPGDLVLTEIMYQPLADDFDGRPNQPEYFELWNRSRRTLSLRDAFWTNRPDQYGAADTTRLGDRPLALAPRGYAVVFAQAQDTDDPARDSRLARAFPDADLTAPTVTLVPMPGQRMGLLVGGERIRLHARDGTSLTETTYTPAWHTPNLPTPRGVALERIDPNRDTNTPLDWTSSRHPEGGTPGGANSVAPNPAASRPAPGDITINEVLFDPLADPTDGRPDQVEYVEFVNRSSSPLELDGVFYTDAPNEQGAADTLRVAFGPTTVAPGGYAVLFAAPNRPVNPATTSQLAAAFPSTDFTDPRITLLPLPRQRLGLRNSGDRIRLHYPDGTILTEVEYVPDWHAHGLLETKGVALERISLSAPVDRPSNWTSSTAPDGGTPGRANSVYLPDSPTTSPPGLTIDPSPFAPTGTGRNTATRIHYVLPYDASTIRVRIFDAMGRPVRTLEAATLASRDGEVIWDGRDDDGRPVRMGVYAVLLDALSADGTRTDRYRESVVVAAPLD